MNKKQQEFVRLRALEGMALSSVMEKMDISRETAEEWDMVFMDEIEDLLLDSFEKIREKYGLGQVHRFQALAATYRRLLDELNKRDFSGLPTDTLYYMMEDVAKKLDIMDENDLAYDQ